MKDGANNETVVHLLTPLGVYSYYRHLRINSRSRYKQEKEKQFLAKETNVQGTGHQINASIKQEMCHRSIECLDEKNVRFECNKRKTQCYLWD